MDIISGNFILEAEVGDISINVTNEAILFKKGIDSVAYVGINVFQGDESLLYGIADNQFVVDVRDRPIGLDFEIIENYDNSTVAIKFTKNIDAVILGYCKLVIKINGTRFSKNIHICTVSDGDKGDIGLDGCIVRNTEWELGKKYFNEVNARKEGTRYLDNVAVIGSNNKANYYQCIKSHESDDTNRPPNAEYWAKIVDTQPTRTPIIIADNAVFRFTQTNRICVIDDEGLVCMQLGGGEYPILLGSVEQGDKYCPFKVDRNGFLYAEQADIKGLIKADRGYFRGFIKRGITTITDNNSKEFIKEIELTEGGMSMKIYQLNFEKLSAIIYIVGDFIRNPLPYCDLPSIQGNTSAFSQDKLDEARSYVGTNIDIYNRSDKFVGFTGLIYNDNDLNTPESISIGMGEVCHLECKIERIDHQEKIYWVYNKHLI